MEDRPSVSAINTSTLDKEFVFLTKSQDYWELIVEPK